MMPLTLKIIDEEFTIHQLASFNNLEELMRRSADFTSLSCTKDEISLICPTGLSEALSFTKVLSSDGGWICLKIQGPLDFSESGVLEKTLRPLAAVDISVVVCGTYNTDYIFIKKEKLQDACKALEDHQIIVKH